jgi:hypothetical protein
MPETVPRKYFVDLNGAIGKFCEHMDNVPLNISEPSRELTDDRLIACVIVPVSARR